MGMTDTSGVQIVINVVDGDSGAVVSQVTKNLTQMGEAGTRTGAQMAQGFKVAAEAGTNAVRQMRTASGEMQQMIANIEAANNKFASMKPPRISTPLGESFANMGTAKAEMEALGNSFARMGEKAAQGGGEAGRGVKKIGEHALTSLDNVRLLRDDLGIRIPRSMEKAIASSKVLSGAIGAVGSGLLIVGAIEIFANLAEGAYRFYQKLTDVNAEMRKYAVQAGLNAQQKMFDTSSIEEVNALLKQTEQGMQRIDDRRKQAGVGVDNSGSFVQYLVSGAKFAATGQAAPLYTADQDKQRAALAANADLLRQRQVTIDAKRAIDLQEAKAAQDGMRLTGAAADEASKRNAIVMARLKADQANKEAIFQRDAVIASNALVRAQNPKMSDEQLRDEKDLKDVPVIAPDLGVQERADAIARAQGEAGAKASKRNYEQTKEATHATAEAGMTGLEGEALYLAKEQEQLRQLTERAKEVGMSARNYQVLRKAIEDTFAGERGKRSRDESERTDALEAGARSAGSTGLAKLDAERDAKLAAQQIASRTFTNPDTLGRNTAAINQEHDAEALKQQQSFTERIAQLDAGRSDRYASDDQRIVASAAKTVTEITKAWEELYKGLGPLDARRVQGQQALNDEIAKINLDAARQRQEAGQRVEDETRRLEDQARRAGLPRYQQETAAIVDEYNERFQKLEEMRVKDAANADRYRRQEIAEEQIKNGKLLEQRRALEDQLAGKLRGLIGSHPLEFLKNQGEEQADKFASQALFKLFPNFSTGLATGTMKHGGADGIFGMPSVFGTGFGGKHPAHVDAGASQLGSGTHNDNPMPSSLKPEISAASTVLTTATATINVQSATFTGLGSSASGEAGGRRGTGNYVPMGNGGYFDIGRGVAGDAGLPGGSSAAAPSTADLGSGGLTSKVQGSLDAGASQLQGMSLDDSGPSVMSGDSKGGDAGGGFGGKLGGEAGAALGLFSAAEGKGGFGGAFSGAASGAKLGAMIAGPMGAAIGAIGGALLGFAGFGARAQAEKYDQRTVKPRIANGLIAFESGQADYQSTFDDMTHLITEAKVETRQMGSGALSYYNSTINPEIKAAQARLTREQKSGRSQFGMSAAQFHQGGMIRDFGSMQTGPDEGWVHTKRREIILNEQAAMSHGDAAMLMNAGVSRSDMASYYGGGSGTMAAQPSGGDVHLHVHAIDAKGVSQFFEDNKHTLRAKLNSSYRENSGGSDSE